MIEFWVLGGITLASLATALWALWARGKDAGAQLGWLRKQNEELRDSMVRVVRREAGLPETPLKPRPKPDPMPDDMAEYIDSLYGPESMRKTLKQDYLRRHVRGETWDALRKHMFAGERAPIAGVVYEREEPFDDEDDDGGEEA